MQVPAVCGRWNAIAITWLSLMASLSHAQTISPHNGSVGLYPVSTSPRFIMNGSEFPDLPVVRLAPLGIYAEISHSGFLHVHEEGHLVNVDASNANDIADQKQFSYISCDPEKYTGNLDASAVFRMVVQSPNANIVILYSETSDHCVATGINSLPDIGGILTTTDTMLASSLAALNLGQNSSGTATILPDLNSYTNSSSGSHDGDTSLNQSPTTAVAMIILYSITGIITALFVVIIVTGAIRAHRHPERYGPRNIVGRGRQSRARGIARAMLETLPIVKFGDPADAAKKPAEGADIELGAGTSPAPATDEQASTDQSTAGGNPTAAGARAPVVIATQNADGTDAEGHLGCSICTEDFKKGEEVRVLPCNHKFHPDCVDPWLLNVSGTCPLCRIDLRPQTQDAISEEAERRGSGTSIPIAQDGETAPPLHGSGLAEEAARQGRRENGLHLRHLAQGSREDRIAALRRLRQETLRSGSNRQTDDERTGLTRRFRERFRIRTERRGTVNDQ
ncbi:hypothetical protein ABEF95_000837 [Exophiala dermatitidis]